MENEAKWCCVSFKANYHNNGLRGIGIVSKRVKSLLRFEIIFLCTDRKYQDKILSDFPVTLELNLGLIFCPWCGVKLEKFYNSYL